MNIQLNVQELFTRYWMAKLAIQMKFPEMTAESLDQIAKSFATQELRHPGGRKTETSTQKPVAKPVRNGSKSKAAPKDNLLGYILTAFEEVFKERGTQKLPAETIFARVVRSGWDTSQYANPKRNFTRQILQYSRRPETGVRRVAPGVYSRAFTVQPSKKAPSKKAPSKKAKRSSPAQDRAIQGRRAVAEGLRPPIKDAIENILGSSTMNIDDIYSALKQKEWLPTSADPRQYLAYLLATSKDRFERVPSQGRGYYRKARSVQVENTVQQP